MDQIKREQLEQRAREFNERKILHELCEKTRKRSNLFLSIPNNVDLTVKELKHLENSDVVPSSD